MYAIYHLDNVEVPMTERNSFMEAVRFIRGKYPRARLTVWRKGTFWTYSRTGKNSVNMMDLFSIVKVMA